MVFNKIVWFDKKKEFLTLLKYFVVQKQTKKAKKKKKKKQKTKTKFVNYNKK